MFIGKLNDVTRREFLHRSSQFAVAGAASSYAMGLAGIGQAAAFNAGDDYKALVCVFLYGGNDHNNMLIPFDAANYARYSEVRGGSGEAGGGVAVPRASLAGTALATPKDQRLTNDIHYALNPVMPRLAARFAEGKLAALLNVGPLVAPLTRAQYDSFDHKSNPRPPKLFSHNDQQSFWQSFGSEGESIGWGGRLGDLAQSSNHNAMYTCITANGSGVFLGGEKSFAYKISSTGAQRIDALHRRSYNVDASEALRAIITRSNGHVLENDFTRVCQRSIVNEAFMNDALAKANVATDFTAGGRLGPQLQIVARIIAARATLGVKRQIFFVGLGGFDNHDALNATHPGLLSELDGGMDAFYRATVELGVADQVTTFTASDFGRTLAMNGDGTDHGWGGHHLIMGGAVNGGRYYGTAPQISIRSDDQVGHGRLLPTTSVDEYSATLAGWFGVSDGELPIISPNIGRFATRDLGFMTKPKAG